MVLKELYFKSIPYLFAYGALRNTIYLTNIPLKKDDLYTKRVGIFTVNTLYTPILFPFLIMNDITNIERKLRKLPIEPFLGGL